MLHVIIKEGLFDEDFICERTVGWEETKALVEHYPPERVAKVCGLRPETIVEEEMDIYARRNDDRQTDLSLGPTAFLFFSTPTTPSACSRNTLIGHAVGTAAGYLSLVATGLTMADRPSLSV